MSRIIGIRHRLKFSVEGEARPTQVAIVEGDNVALHNLSNEQAELDFVLGVFPTKLRAIGDDESPDLFREHHIKWRKLGDDDDRSKIHEAHLKQEGKIWYRVHRVPAAYDGLFKGDQVAMVLGGSGDYFAFALAHQGETVGAEVYRVPSFKLAEARGDADKKNDARTLADLLATDPGLFYPITHRDRKTIHVREGLRMRTDAMKARIACEQRLRQRFIGTIFCDDEGGFPEGAIEDSFREQAANDDILLALKAEEKRRERELVKAAGDLDVFKEVFEGIEGCGPMIASRVIASIIDIKRFASADKLKRYAGVHVTEEGTFPRRRRGNVANWNPSLRQGLYLIGDQFNRRPDSHWGKELRKYKTRLREKHPEVEVMKNGKKRYTNGHIHKMATWRTITRFTEWLFRAWWDFEMRSQEVSKGKLEEAA